MSAIERLQQVEQYLTTWGSLSPDTVKDMAMKSVTSTPVAALLGIGVISVLFRTLAVPVSVMVGTLSLAGASVYTTERKLTAQKTASSADDAALKADAAALGQLSIGECGDRPAINLALLRHPEARLPLFDQYVQCYGRK
jgi:hypothetical protein